MLSSRSTYWVGCWAMCALLGCTDDDGAARQSAAGGGGQSTSTGGESATGGGGGSSGAAGGMGGATGGVAGAGGTAGAGASGGAGGSGGGGGMPMVNCDPPVVSPPPLELVPFVTGFERPIDMAQDPNDLSRFYVAERTGKIRVVENGVLLAAPFLDVSSEVSCCGDDQGFLGIALHPDYASNGRFFVHYTKEGTVADSTTVLAEYKRSVDDPNVADAAPVAELMVLDQTVVWHYGGTLAFGPDGYLYYSRGDGGGAGDPEGDAQVLTNPLGKILRLDVDNFPIPPPGNMQGGNPHIWSYGLRNVWRMSFDRCTGDLYMGDVGQGSWEEINFQPAGTGHQNWGWNFLEGTSCYTAGCDPVGTTLPIAEYPHDGGRCAVIGGYVYRGHAIPGLRGRYLYGDICSNRVFSFVEAGGIATDPIELTSELETALMISDYGMLSFGQDATGEVYILDSAGTIWRIDAE